MKYLWLEAVIKMLEFCAGQKVEEMGFVQTDSDLCIYMATEGEMFVIAVHVDDIVLATKSDKRMAEVKKGLAEGFKV